MMMDSTVARAPQASTISMNQTKLTFTSNPPAAGWLEVLPASHTCGSRRSSGDDSRIRVTARNSLSLPDVKLLDPPGGKGFLQASYHPSTEGADSTETVTSCKCSDNGEESIEIQPRPCFFCHSCRSVDAADSSASPVTHDGMDTWNGWMIIRRNIHPRRVRLGVLLSLNF